MSQNPSNLYLDLSITSRLGDSFQTRLSEFSDGSFEFTFISQFREYARNSDNGVIEWGPSEHRNYQIRGTTYLSEEQYRLLDLIDQAHNDHISSRTGSGGITVVSTYLQINENGPRTRPLAPSTTETLVGSNSRYYYPRFKMKFSIFEPQPVLIGSDIPRPLRFELTELDRFTP